MDSRRLVTGTLAGGMTLFVLGYLIFDLAFASFYVANAGSATGVMREGQLVWAVILGSLSYAALITYAMGSRNGPMTVGTGATIGAIVGFLLWFTADFVIYGISNIQNLTRTIVDPVLEAVRAGVAGAVIAAALARMPVAVR
jgi:hypothetical protein